MPNVICVVCTGLTHMRVKPLRPLMLAGHSQTHFKGFMDSTQVMAVMKHNETYVCECHGSEGNVTAALRVE